MKVITLILAVVVLAVAGFAIWVRVAPIDPALWHVDPLTAAKPGKPNHWLLRSDGDGPALRLSLTPQEAAARIDAIALATPRTTTVAGAGDWVTYVTRSRLWGFPDFTSIRISPVEGGSEVSIFARSRFGESDLGVNRKRVEDWASQLAS